MRVSFDKYTEYILTSDQLSYMTVNGSVYTILSNFYYRGKNNVGNLLKIRAICWVDVGSTAKIKIYDYTNSNLIVEKTGISNSTKEIIDLGTVSNIPDEQTIFELQIASEDTGKKINIASLIFEYE